MFLRRIRKKARGEAYEYWALCEAYRTAKGPRQRVVATLGKLDREEADAGWEDIEALLEGREPRKKPVQLQLEEQAPAPSTPSRERWELADLGSLRVERSRDFGEVYLALALWKRLGLGKLLEELMPRGRETVRWADMAAVLACARFCGQESELKIAESWYEGTALEDILAIDAASVNDDRLYRALDVLGRRKDELCDHLMERYQDWFGVDFEFLLYDVTSTYFEGQAMANGKAARGYSRDKRSDCKQVCIGLVCAPDGLPLSYEVFAGNRTDVTTVQEIVSKMEERFGKAKRIWVMDRGMVSGANLEFLRSRGARYLVGAPNSELRHFKSELSEKDGWSEVQSGLEARLVGHPQRGGEETYVLCRSVARSEKERAMLDKQVDSLTAELLKVQSSLHRRASKELEKLQRRIGRWLGRYPAAAKVLRAELMYAKDGSAVGLSIYSDLKAGQKAALSQGAYLLRTNCDERDPAKLWRWYIQLTQAEAAFRTSKSDLGMRPIFHQKTDRVEAHILVCFIALAMWRSLEMWMSSKGLGTCARKLIEQLGKVRSMDVVVPIRRGESDATLRIRTVEKPDEATRNLLNHLGLRLPNRNQMTEM